MIDIANTQAELMLKSDLDWFDSICALLKKENNVTVSLMTDIIGTENSDITKERRGSKFLIPFDKRFNHSCINPDIDSNDEDTKLEYLSFAGPNFSLKFEDVRGRFNDFVINSNVYDGGSQLFFHPVSETFEFSAISFEIREERENIKNIDDLVLNAVAFHFGSRLVEHRAGYSMVK